MTYAASCERINGALHTLRKELTLMREQDLQLLKQLIHIHETIRKLSNGRRGIKPSPSSQSLRGLNNSNGLITINKRTPLVRQQSEPHFCVDSGFYRRISTSSTDEYYDFPDDCLSSESEFDESYSSIRSLRPFEKFRTRSISVIATVPLDCDDLSASNASYAEILDKNIRLWKWSQSIDRDSVLDDDAFIIAESDEDR